MRGCADNPSARVEALVARYSDPLASAVWWLCDRHDPCTVAYSLVAADLSSLDVTYGELRAESEQLAGALAAQGLAAGDRIATLMGKRREYLVTVLAIWRLGAVHVPLFTAFAAPAIGFRVRASACRAIVCDAAQRPKLESSEALPDDPRPLVITTGAADRHSTSYRSLLASSRGASGPTALGGNTPLIQIYTSGTTGTPKGVIVPVRALAAFQIYAEYGLGLRADDVSWNAADPGWAYGLYLGVLATFLTGVRGILVDSPFSPELTAQVLLRYGVTHFAGAPTLFRSLRASDVSLSGHRVRGASSAGEPLTPEVNDWARAALGVAVHDHYGQSETGMLINNHHHTLLQRTLKPGSMGHAMPGWQALVLKADENAPAAAGETGRVAIDLAESPLAWFTGYVGAAEQTAEKFSACRRWYLTGDSGRVDEEGYFYFSARDDDVIIMAGYRIGPFEVESILVQHPAIEECAVVAAPDAVRGEVLEAVVVLNAGRVPSESLTADLQQWIKQRYAAHAYPRRVHYVQTLPKTASGKIQRFALRNQLRDRGSVS